MHSLKSSSLPFFKKCSDPLRVYPFIEIFFFTFKKKKTVLTPTKSGRSVGNTWDWSGISASAEGFELLPALKRPLNLSQRLDKKRGNSRFPADHILDRVCRKMADWVKSLGQNTAVR